MSFIESRDLADIMSRLVGGMKKEKQQEAKDLLTEFFTIIADQLKFGNQITIKDFATFTPEETQKPGQDATFMIKVKPGKMLTDAAKELDKRFGKTGMPNPMLNAVTGKTHRGLGTGKEEHSE